MKGIAKFGYLPIAGLMKPSQELNALYEGAGFKTVAMPWIPKLITWAGSEGKSWNPFVWLSIIKSSLKWRSAKKKTLNLIAKLKIDLVHLNSVSLSNPAELLNKEEIPFVWHIRENGPSHKGARFKYIQSNLLKSSELIFLSKAERLSWIGNHNHGNVVHNFIDFKQFDYGINTTELRKKLNLKADQKVILYVGGLKKHKGIDNLLDAIALIKKNFGSNFICLMPDGLPKNPKSNSFEKEILDKIKTFDIADQCMLLPFNPSIVDLYAVCDVLTFPATQPHFARPVIEASAMKKPVVASNLACIDELVVNNETGFLIEPNQPKLLSDKIIQLFTDISLTNKMGSQGFEFAKENFEFNNQVDKILNIYKRLEN